MLLSRYNRANRILWIGAAFICALAAVILAGGVKAAGPGRLNVEVRSAPQITATATPCPGDYSITQTAGQSLVPGSTLVPGSQCDDCAVSLALPFSYSLYDRSFTSASLTANGQMVFSTPVDPSYSNTCLPDPNTSYSIFAHWTDLTTDSGYLACQQYPAGCGIFSSVSGSAPNRTFNVEWRALTFNVQHPVNFEIKLYEGQQRFDVVYALVDTPGVSDTATVGVQQGTGATFTTYQCSEQAGTLANGVRLEFDYATECGSATPTPTFTSTATRTSSRTGTRTNSPTSTPTTTLTNTPTRTTTVTPTRASTSTSTSTVTSTASPTNTASPTSTPGSPSAVLVGHIVWQARGTQPGALQQLPLTLTLRLGSTQVAFPSETTDASGFFTVSVGSLVPGTYEWHVKGTRWLANAGTIELTGAAMTQAHMGLLRSGDSNGDNFDNLADFNILRPAFDRACGEPGYDPRAEYNGDCLVMSYDWYALRSNYGSSGAPPPGMGRR